MVYDVMFDYVEEIFARLNWLIENSNPLRILLLNQLFHRELGDFSNF